MADIFSGNYAGNQIFYNPDVTQQAINEICNICDDVSDLCDSVLQEDKYFDSVPERYKSLIPSKRFSDLYRGITVQLSGANRRVLSQIGAITGAIQDYCSGDGFSDETIAILNRESKYMSSPGFSGDSGNSDVGIGVNSNSNSNKNDDLNNNELDSESIPTLPDDSINSGDLGLDNDDELMVLDEDVLIPTINTNTTGNMQIPNSGDESLIMNDDITSTGDLNNTNNPFNMASTSSFSIPSILGLSGNSVDAKKTNMVAASGIALAATSAIGGKIFYDRKKNNNTEDDDKEDDDDYVFDDDIEDEMLDLDDELDDDKQVMNNMVDFKNSLLENDEVSF